MREKVADEFTMRDKWYAEAEDVTLAQLPEFIRHITKDYNHSYGTSVYAVSAILRAATKVADQEMEVFGLTGFQASMVGWEMVRHLLYVEAGHLTNFEDLLYPQYAYRFNRLSIPSRTWEWLQERAKKNLSENDPYTHPDVLAHWESMVKGRVPFDLKVGDN